MPRATPSSITPSFTKLPIALSIGMLMLAGCHSGASFSTPSVISAGTAPVAPTPDTPITTNPATSVPAVPTPATPSASNPATSAPATPSATPNLNAPLLAPMTKAALAIPKRDIAYNADRIATQPQVSLDPNAIAPSTLDELKSLLSASAKAQKLEDPTVYTNDNNNAGYQFVRAGWVYAGFYPSAYDEKTDANGIITSKMPMGEGFVYVEGQNPAKATPKGRVAYTGHWDFVSDVKEFRGSYINSHNQPTPKDGGGGNFGMKERFGNEIGATSFAKDNFGKIIPSAANPNPQNRADHHATFTADFDDKKLTGTLGQSNQKTANKDNITQKDNYRIDATISGNRFFGSAIALDKSDEYNLLTQDAHERLEGGFYGDNAEELAGRFMSDDNSVFGVFAAKQKTHTATLTPKYDGIYVEVTQDKDINPAQKAQILDLPNLGNTQQIIISGKTIELAPLATKKTSEQIVDLGDEQTAKILSFGSADGALRLGFIQKSAPKNTTPAVALPAPSVSVPAPVAPVAPAISEKDIKAAKTKLEQYVSDKGDALSQKLEAYAELEDDNEKAVFFKDIQKQIVLGYSDEAKMALESDLKDILDAIKTSGAGDDEDAWQKSVDDALAFFKAGDKFDPEIDANWQTYLPTNTAPSPKNPPKNTYSDDDIKKATHELQNYIDESKAELAEMIALTKEDNELVLAVIEKTQESYSETSHSAIKQQTQSLISQYQKGDDSAADKIVALFSKGDKLNPSNLDNLRDYLPTATATTATAPTIATATNYAPIGIDQSISGLFLLGERTELDKIPNRGTATYHGTWHGKIGNYWQSSAGYKPYDGKTKIDVDFNAKVLNGVLVESSGLESNPAFTLKATINGNGFKGSATSRDEINLDKGAQQNQKILGQITTDNLTGAFYGQNAEHIGGAFSFDGTLKGGDERVVGGVVFYGTTDGVKE